MCVFAGVVCIRHNYLIIYTPTHYFHKHVHTHAQTPINACGGGKNIKGMGVKRETLDGNTKFKASDLMFCETIGNRIYISAMHLRIHQKNETITNDT